ncbi:MAG: hypothetical protein HC857_15760 [Synechococcales cyanobacterium RU_4_20]|nr:hypothetical protein [Synechococcales cyanobacterium RU_4_20]
MAAQSSFGDRTLPTHASARSSPKPASELLSQPLPPQSGLDGEHQGRFRVGNQTEHPLRVAFLSAA